MKLLALLVIIALGGCMAPMTGGAILGQLAGVAVDAAVDTAFAGEPTCGGQVKCGGDARAALREQREGDARDRATILHDRALTRRALGAAATGDCATVVAIDGALASADGDDGIDGGFHDTVFLRYAPILRCLASQRLARAAARDLAVGRTAEAIAGYTRAYALANDPTALLGLASAHATAGHCDEAREYLELVRQSGRRDLAASAEEHASACATPSGTLHE